MASQEMLGQLDNSSTSSTSDEDENDASTSSEEDNGLVKAQDAMSVDDDDDDDDDNDKKAVGSPHSTPKPRIKLTLRTSMSSVGDESNKKRRIEAVNALNGGLNGDANASKIPRNEINVKREDSATPDSSQNPTLSTTAPVKQEAAITTPPAAATMAASGPITAVPAMPKTESKQSPISAKPGNAEVNFDNKDVAMSDVTPKAVKIEPNTSNEDKAHTEVKVKIEDNETETNDKAIDKKTEDKVKTEPAATATATVTTNGKTTFKIGPASISSSDPLKKKMKKKLPKLPLSMKRKLPLKGAADAVDGTAKAKVVEGSNAGEADVVATVIEGASPTMSKPNNKVQPASSMKRKQQTQSKPIRLPPMTSPGLLISQASAGLYRSAVDSTGFATPAAIFDQSMATAGYTTEGRTKRPHRGSSVKRVVGDMFDSNVAFTLHFPDLVPKDLWFGQPPKKPEENDENNGSGASDKSTNTVPHLLMKSLEKGMSKIDKQAKEQEPINGGRENVSRKRQRPGQFSDMIPVSLTIPYPESFLEKRLEYVKEVQERERAIIAFQETQEKLEIAQEEKEFLFGKDENNEKPKINNPVKIPPIPVPPTPPKLAEFDGMDVDQYEDKHPIYLPKGKKNFLSHLDKDCFHITEGRYFGLKSNSIADPHFVGANAPGISGLTLSGGSGLATSTSSGSAVTAGASILALAASTNDNSAGGGASAAEKTSQKEGSAPKSSKKTASLPAVVKSGSKSKFKLKHVGPTPTANASDLRKLMEEGGELAEKMKTCIIRAAVHASRSGKHNQSWLAPDGKAYPDVSKAFAAHAGLKPCTRCKNNKQGAYHCRLRRKHKELDHDGGNSPAVLAPLLLVPMEDLLINPKSLK